ncbi:hypothetical protein AKO1_007692 [Acrasis kona]|uniref:TATA element modulatory factor 1 TATA binding domain-containing protein n=1 Tax=Acrasis kona TaxID=1008807 RepID=A0AAW2YRY4_9EUKA
MSMFGSWIKQIESTIDQALDINDAPKKNDVEVEKKKELEEQKKIKQEEEERKRKIEEQKKELQKQVQLNEDAKKAAVELITTIKQPIVEVNKEDLESINTQVSEMSVTVEDADYIRVDFTPIRTSDAEKTTEHPMIELFRKKLMLEMQNKVERENIIDQLNNTVKTLTQNNTTLTSSLSDAKLETIGQKELLEQLREEFRVKLLKEERRIIELQEKAASAEQNEQLAKQVTAEGEKLSIKVGQLEVSVRKFKKQAADAEDSKKQLQSRIDALTATETKNKQDITTLKSQLQEQTDNVKKLESSNSSFGEVSRVKTELESKLNEANKLLEQSKLDAIDQVNQTIKQMQIKMDDQTQKHEHAMTQYRFEMDKLRDTLSYYTGTEEKKHQSLRKEIDQLLKRCVEAESKSEEMVDIIPDSTRPLIEQILSLESTSQAKQENYNRMQRTLENKIKIAENKCKMLERDVNKANQTIQTLQASETEKQQQINALLFNVESAQEEVEKTKKTFTMDKQLHDDLNRINQELSARSEQLSTELNLYKTQVEEYNITMGQQQEQQQQPTDKNEQEQETITTSQNDEEESNTNTLSVEQTIRSQSSQIKSLLERVDSLESARATLNQDIYSLSDEKKRVEGELEKLVLIESEFTKLQNVHNHALDLLGEKEEKILEMEQDMSYVKSTFRNQILELLTEMETLKSKA